MKEKWIIDEKIHSLLYDDRSGVYRSQMDSVGNKKIGRNLFV